MTPLPHGARRHSLALKKEPGGYRDRSQKHAGGHLSLGCRADLAGRGAQPSSKKPVTLVVPYAAGGGTDTVSRLIAEHMSSRARPHGHH